MFGLGSEVILLVIIGLLLFGPEKLPQLMRQVGRVMREIKKASNEFQYSIERELDQDQYARAHKRARKKARLAAEKAKQEGKSQEEILAAAAKAAGDSGMSLAALGGPDKVLGTKPPAAATNGSNGVSAPEPAPVPTTGAPTSAPPAPEPPRAAAAGSKPNGS